MKISLQLNPIKAALQCASKKDLRTYLKGVCLEFNKPDRAMVYGCNGHMLFAGQSCISFDSENNFDCFNHGSRIIIPYEIVKSIKSKNSHVELENLGNGFFMIDNIKFSAIDGVFPDVTRVVPTIAQLSTREKKSAHYNYDYLNACNNALNIFYGTKNKIYTLDQYGDNSGIMHHGLSDALCVIMPIRAEKTDSGNFQGLNLDYFFYNAPLQKAA